MSYDCDNSFLSSKFSKDNTCFSNLFKNGDSSFSILSSSTFTMHLKLSLTKEKAFVVYPSAILA